MNPIERLNELRSTYLAEHDQILDTADTEKRDLTDEQDARCVEIRKELKALEKKIADAQFIEQQRENQAAINADLKKAGIKRHYHAAPTDDAKKLSKDDEKTVRSFSFLKFIREAGDQNLTGVEKEMHEEAVIEARHSGISIDNFGIPQAVVGTRSVEKRDHTAGTAGEGGNTIATELRGFIPALRENLVLTQMGATYLTGLTGDIDIPRQITKTSPTEAAENDTAGEENITFDQLSLSPERLPAFSDVSKKLVRQSSLDVENLVIRDLQRQMITRIQDMAINGSGSSNQPEGILNVTGIGDVAGGTNGAAPTHDHLVDLESEVAIDDADMGRLAYFSNAAVRGKLKKTKVDSGSGLFVWGANESQLNGYPVFTSNTVPSTLTKGTASGVCSAIVFGNWEELIIAQWGGLDVLVNPYTKGKEGLIEIIVDTFYNVGVRHAESFSAMQDALTS